MSDLVVRLVGVGSALPRGPISNQLLRDTANLPPETSVDFMEKKIGISERFSSRKMPETPDQLPGWDWAKSFGAREGMRNSDLSCTAVKNALEHANLTLADLDMLIHASCTPDYPVPPTSSIIQDKLGIPSLCVMDIRSACCGSTQGVFTAVQFLKARTFRTIAVVGCDVGSVFGILDCDDPHYTRSDGVNACMIGDAAACMLLQAVDTESPLAKSGIEVVDVKTCCIGHGKKPGIWLPAGGSNHPCCHDTVDQGLHHFLHDYKAVIEHGPQLYMHAVTACLKRNSLSLVDVDLIIPHQANGKVVEIGAALGGDPARLFANFSRVGNTANASLPLCLDEVVRAKKVAPGGLIMMLAAESTKWIYGYTLLRVHSYTAGDSMEGDQLARAVASTPQRVLSNTRLFMVNALLQIRQYYTSLMESYYGGT